MNENTHAFQTDGNKHLLAYVSVQINLENCPSLIQATTGLEALEQNLYCTSDRPLSFINRTKLHPVPECMTSEKQFILL